MIYFYYNKYPNIYYKGEYITMNTEFEEIFIEWKQIVIKGYKTNYMISTDGHVMNITTKKILKNKVSTTGYYTVCILYKNKRHTRKVYRLVANAFIPNPENKREVNHINGNKLDNRVENLEWATSKENKQHAIALGLYKNASFNTKGSERSSATHTEEDAHKVCQLLELGFGITKISRMLNFKYSFINNIKNRNKWKHISSQYNIK